MADVNRLLWKRDSVASANLNVAYSYKEQDVVDSYDLPCPKGHGT